MAYGMSALVFGLTAFLSRCSKLCSSMGSGFIGALSPYELSTSHVNTDTEFNRICPYDKAACGEHCTIPIDHLCSEMYAGRLHVMSVLRTPGVTSISLVTSGEGSPICAAGTWCTRGNCTLMSQIQTYCLLYRQTCYYYHPILCIGTFLFLLCRRLRRTEYRCTSGVRSTCVGCGHHIRLRECLLQRRHLQFDLVNIFKIIRLRVFRLQILQRAFDVRVVVLGQVGVLDQDWVLHPQLGDGAASVCVQHDSTSCASGFLLL